MLRFCTCSGAGAKDEVLDCEDDIVCLLLRLLGCCLCVSELLCGGVCWGVEKQENNHANDRNAQASLSKRGERGKVSNKKQTDTGGHPEEACEPQHTVRGVESPSLGRPVVQQ